MLGWIYADDESEKQLFTAVGSLRYLKELDLASNDIVTRALGLDLNATNYTQTATRALANALSSLQLLEKLVLREFFNDGEIQKQVFTAVGSLRYLKKLNFRKSFIAQNAAQALAKTLCSLQLLEKLELVTVEDYYKGESHEQVFTAVQSLRYLKGLDLNATNYTQTGTLALADALPFLQLLEKLVLGRIDRDDDGECQEQLFTAVGSLRYLKELDLKKTYIAQTGARALANSLSSLQLLEKLVLGEIDDDGESRKQVFTAVGSLRYLKELALKDVYISQTGARALADALPSLQLLEKLVLEWMDGDDESKKQVFTAVGSLRYLKELDLDLTYINETGTRALANSLPSLQLLEKLLLGKMFNDDESQKQVFTAVGSLRYLKILDLRRTFIAQTATRALANSLPSLHLLEELFVGEIFNDDESQKQVSTAVGSLRCLKILYLTYKTYIAHTGALTLADSLLSLEFFKILQVGMMFNGNESHIKLFPAVGSLRYLMDLDLSETTISQTVVATLVGVLPSLHPAASIFIPEVEYDDDETFKRELEEAADSLGV